MSRPDSTARVAGDRLSLPSLLATVGLCLVDLVVLFKLRVVGLLLFAALGGAFLAADGWPGITTMAVLLVAGGMAAAGASAINEYLERGLDARMERTQHRPLARNNLPHAGWVPILGALMILAPVLAVLPFLPAMSVFLLLGAVVYIGVYTVWLKPRTPLNIIVGGLAGSAAVLSGSAAAGAWSDPGALLLALTVFVWTPTHFWSLAIAHRDDYARGGFPMMPVQSSPRTAAHWVLGHALCASVAALAMASQLDRPTLYLVPVSLATVYWLVRNLQLVQQPVPRRAMAVFGASNLYLAVVLLMVCVCTWSS